MSGANRTSSGSLHNRSNHAFTLVELLVVIAIVALLIALLLPTIAAARAAARTALCGTRVYQITQALQLYASEYRGYFPPNTTLPGRAWYQNDKAGKYLVPSRSEALGPVVTCPDDPDAARSYSMNVWASSTLDTLVLTSGYGRAWKANVSGGSKMILVTERWSSSFTVGQWTSPAFIGGSRDTPGRKFGVGGGVALMNANRWGMVNCELAYARHRARKGPGSGTQPVGRVQVGYADGHVALKEWSQLGDPVTGLSTLDSWWSPADVALNR